MKKIILLTVTSLLLVACSETRYAAHIVKQIPIPGEQKTVGYYKVGSPYTIKGRQYAPREEFSKIETGMASWYGPQFHGKLTANGEIFDKYELTAAHRTLQMPSIIRVTNLSNGRSAVLRVNDRGPFAHDRVLDVSERAATILGFKNEGTARVRIEVLPQESRTVAAMAKEGRDTTGFEIALNQPDYAPAGSSTRDQTLLADSLAPKPPQTPIAKVASANPSDMTVLSEPLDQTQTVGNFAQKIYVQAGSFSDEQNAISMSNRLSSLAPSKVYLTRVNDRPFYRVRLGPFGNEADAHKIVTALTEHGNNTASIIKD